MDAAPLSADCSQLDLPWRQSAALASAQVYPAHVAELYQILRKHGGWMTAQAIRAERPEWDERYVRALASASLDILSAPGSPGYRLFDTASEGEITRCAAPLMSQGQRMFRKGAGYLRRLHSRGGR